MVRAYNSEGTRPYRVGAVSRTDISTACESEFKNHCVLTSSIVLWYIMYLHTRDSVVYIHETSRVVQQNIIYQNQCFLSHVGQIAISF